MNASQYASFFFLAFIAQYLPSSPGTDPSFVGQCGAVNCMQPLSLNLGIIFGMRLIVTNLSDIVASWVSRALKARDETQGVPAEAIGTRIN